MKKDLLKLYALHKAGFGIDDDFTELVSKCIGMEKDELAGKYKEITSRINSNHNYKTPEEFGRLIYLEYLALFAEEEK